MTTKLANIIETSPNKEGWVQREEVLKASTLPVTDSRRSKRGLMQVEQPLLSIPTEGKFQNNMYNLKIVVYIIDSKILLH